jgi:class 3 adenylate cyclase/tetratricopeptide (TPR) repeat protein
MERDQGVTESNDLEALDRAIAALEGQRATLGDNVVDTALAPLIEKKARLQAGGEQRKLVTVLFADVVDFTVLSQRLDPEDTRRVMNRYFAAWRRAIAAEGGTVEKFIGDAVMAVFGIHRAREDDPHRAVRAALAMRDTLDALADEIVAEHGIAIEMRVGIDTGEVVVSTLGDRGVDDFVVVGETVNRAARIQAAAPPGGILISADTVDHVRGSFGLQRLEALQLKGIADPVEAYLVQSGEIQTFWPETRGIEGVSTRTVGRELEMGRLQKLFADLADERAWRIISVIGDAGIGKSRLIHDFENWLAALPDGVWVLRGRAAPTTEDVAHGLLRSAFAGRLRIQDTDSPAVVRNKWERGLASLVGRGDAPWAGSDVVATWLGFYLGESPELASLRVDPESLQRRARQLVIELFRVLCLQAPVVILLEDLHWADSATLDWLEEVGTTPPDFPLLIVATARPALFEKRPHWGEGLDAHTDVRLDPLSKREGRALVADILQRADEVPEALATVVVAAAEGNPFFIEELVKWLIDQGVIEKGIDHWTVLEDAIGGTRVPATLRGLLQARLDSLDPTDRSVIERASVVGRIFWDRAVATLGEDSTEPTSDESYTRLRSREVVFQRPTSAFDDAREFSFRHALMRDVAYDGVLRSRRRRYHALAARWLQEMIERSHRPDEHAATLARHLAEAGEDLEAARWYLRAGSHASGTFSSDNALTLFDAAARLAPKSDPELEFDILLARESVLDRLGRREEQRRVLDAMSATDLDDGRQAQTRLAEGRWLFFHSDYTSVEPLADEAAVFARQAGDVELELDALILGGRTRAFRNEHQEARASLERVLDHARREDSPRHVAESLRLLAIVATNLSESETAAAYLDESSAVFRRIGDLEGEALCVAQLSAVYIGMERYDEARLLGEKAVGMFEESGHQLRRGIVLGNLVSIAIEQGRFDDALRLATETLELTESLDDPEGIVSTLLRLGEIHRLTGGPAEAREHFVRGVEVGRRYELHYFLAFILSGLVALDLADGLGDARTHADQCLESAARSDVPHAQVRAVLVDGPVSLAEGDPVGAADRLRKAIDLHADLEYESERLEARSARAVALVGVGGREEAGMAARQVTTDMLDRGVPAGSFAPGQPILDAYRVLAELGDPEARRLAEAAEGYLEERAAAIADAALRSRFLSTPVNRALAALAAPA